MFHQIYKKPDSKPSLQVQRLLWRASQLRDQVRCRLRRITSFEETDSVEGQSRSFRIWMFSSFGALICILLLNLHLNASSDDGTPKERITESPDLVSQIPPGHVLVPIEPMNLDAIDAVFGQHGWADIFVDRDDVDTTFRPSNKPARRRIAVGVPMIRAPRNPSRLAVIIAETETQLISELGQPVHVALRRSASRPTAPKTIARVRRTRQDLSPAIIRLELVHEDGIADSN